MFDIAPTREPSDAGARASTGTSRMDPGQLAGDWAKAIRDYAKVVGHPNPQPVLRELVNLIHDEAWSRNGDFSDVGQKIGGRLAETFHGDPATLEATQRFLLETLLDSSGRGLTALATGANISLISAIASGYAATSRRKLLEEQHLLHQPTVEVMWDAQHALFESEARFRAVFDGSIVGMSVHDLDGKTLNANAALLAIVRQELHEIIGEPVESVLIPASEPDAFAWEHFPDLADGTRTTHQAEVLFTRKDGSEFWANLSRSLIRDQDGSPSYVISLIQDITDRKQSEILLRQNEQRVRTLIQNSSDIICVISATGVTEFISPSITRILGLSSDELLGGHFVDLITEESRTSFELILADLRDRPNQTVRAEMRGCHRDGSWRWLEVVCTNLVDVENIGGFVINARDVTDRKVFEQQLEWQAFHDPLTALPNRMHFQKRLDQELAQAARDRRSVGVLFLDLDRFKRINDSLGHSGGDQTLVSVGQRILDALGPGEMVARFGGDEFAVLMDDATAASAKSAALRILRALQRPVPMLHRLSSVEASIGIAISGDGLDQADSLLRAADIALYRAKALGGGVTIIFESHMHSEAIGRIELETDLQLALERNEINPYFQPIYDLHTGEIHGLEVLMRWHRRSHGLTLPDQFLPFAEETGIIAQLGEVTFREGCRQLRRWIDAGIVPDDLYLSFNLSQRETRLLDLVETIERILEDTRIDPARIRFELASEIILTGDEIRMRNIAKLRDLGARLTIDQFGSGPTTIAHLGELPISGIKIDRSFHAKALEAHPEGEIVGAILSIASRFHMKVTIVGIDSEDKLEKARATGFHCGQGFHLCPPLSADGITALLG